MDFSSLSSGSLIGKLMRFPLRLLPDTARVPVLQGALRGRRWIVGSSNHGCWLGSYELPKQRAFAAAIHPGATVLDVGANVGFYTLLAATQAGPAGQVFAFEPVPRNIGYLKEHVRLNELRNVRVVEAAVSDRSGTAFFDEGPSPSMGYLADAGRVPVQTVTLDELFRAGEIPAPHVLKIDVEGAEGRVLRGARELLMAARPTIFLATHGAEIHRECSDYLTSLGFRLEAVSGGNLEETDEITAHPV